MCGEFIWVVDQVAAGSEADMIGVGFLGSVVYDDADICDCAIFRNVAYFVMGKDVDCVGSWCAGEVVALG